jgi:Peptidase A4 family
LPLLPTSAWRGFAAATVVLAAASAGSGLSGIALVIGETRADLSASEPIPRSAAKHAPTRLLRNSGGTESVGSNAAFNSANWSGYLAPSQSAGQPYTSAAGRWIVPPVSYITGRGISVNASSIWVGIGGLNGDQTLIQVGTEQDASATGATTYYAWYETLPANQISLSPQQYPVRPGDVVGASLQCTASCTAGAAQSWTLAMTDYTAGWSWTSPNVPYASSLGSAEWILEAPSTGRGLELPLASFGSTTIFADLVNGASPGLPASQSIALIDPLGSATSNPSNPVDGIAFDLCWGSGARLTACSPPPVALAAAVLPSSRSVQLGNPATAFATLINAGPTTAAGCTIAPITSIPAGFAYQTTSPATNALTGTPNTPVNLAAGAAQSFVIAFTPTAPLDPTDVALGFVCSTLLGAPVTPGVNTLLLSASATPVPDIVALAATASNDGILHIPGNSGSNAFAVATVNLGASAMITAAANTGPANLPLAISICQTNPTTGQCLTAAGPSAATVITGGATPTFGIFATAIAGVPFLPATNRIFVEFSDANEVVRGSTSVAVETQ